MLVVGGGISGLSAAHFLLRDSSGLEVRLVEADARLGGAIGSDIVDGFVIERGPNGFLDSAPETLALAAELDLGASLVRSALSAKRRYLYTRGRLLPVPSGSIAFLRSPLLSLGGRLRVLTEPFRRRAAGRDDESLGSFARRRLGGEATAVFLDAVQTGVYAGDVERLSVQSAFPRLARLEREHGSLFRGLLRSRKAKRQEARVVPRGETAAAAQHGVRLCSFRTGLEELVRALAGRLGASVATGVAAERVSREAGGVRVTFRDGRSELHDAVVVAVPAPRAAALFASSRPPLARALELLLYAPIAVVSLGMRREDVAHPLDGFGFLVPRREGLRSLGMIWVSTVFPEHAPDGCVSLRAMLGGARDPEVVERSADELEAIVRGELGAVLGLAGKPLVRKIHRYVQGIPQYNVGHARNLRRIEDEQRSLAGVFLTGNAYRGVGINDCVRESLAVSRAVLGYLAAAS